MLSNPAARSIESGNFPLGSSKKKPDFLHERKLILSKADGRCHICGGPVGDKWQADHVKAHSAEGRTYA
jgi:hypothetical protein